MYLGILVTSLAIDSYVDVLFIALKMVIYDRCYFRSYYGDDHWDERGDEHSLASRHAHLANKQKCF